MNTYDRDFKGIWIPKEIWLNENLTLLEKIIFVEIDSLDNENHCIAGNEYFANFCGCSESKITKAISKLQSLNMIEVVSFDGRHRKLRVVKTDMQGSKKYDSESEKVRANNIDSNIVNSNTISKDIVQDEPVQTLQNEDNNSQLSEYEQHMYEDDVRQIRNIPKPKQKRLSLWDKCVQSIDEYTDNDKLHSVLISYLKMRLEIKDKPMYTNMWKGLLNKLSEFPEEDRIEIVQYSLERGYASFYALKKNNNTRYSKPDVSTFGENEENKSIKVTNAEREERFKNGTVF